MDTSPKDKAALLWDAKSAPACKPRPGELLFEFVRGSDGAPMSCELRYHGEYGVEAQFLERGTLSFSRRFDTRALGVQWAELERGDIEAAKLASPSP